MQHPTHDVPTHDGIHKIPQTEIIGVIMTLISMAQLIERLANEMLFPLKARAYIVFIKLHILLKARSVHLSQAYFQSIKGPQLVENESWVI